MNSESTPPEPQQPPVEDPNNPNLDAETLAQIKQPPATDQIQRDRDPEELRTNRQLLPTMLNNPGNLRSDLLEDE